MIRTVLLATTIAFAVPAIAQEQGPTAVTMAETDASSPAADASVNADANVTTADATAAQSTNAATGKVDDIVNAEFASYDADKSGELSKDEFAKWMIALRAKSGAAAETADASTWANAAFAQADKDKNKAVSQTELTSFLQG